MNNNKINKKITTSLTIMTLFALLFIPSVMMNDATAQIPPNDITNYELMLEFDTLQRFGLSGIGVDNSNGDIYVSSTSSPDHIDRYDSSGVYLDRYMSQGDAFGQVQGPFDIEIDDDGNVIVADAQNGRIQLLTTFGNFTINTVAPGSLFFGGSEGIDVDNSGNIYVADHEEEKIKVYNYTGALQFEFGESDNDDHGADGKFSHAVDVAVDTIGNIYVADNNNERIQIFDSIGNFVSNINQESNIEMESIDVDNDGHIAVLGHTPDVYIYDSDRNLSQIIDTGLDNNVRGLKYDDAGRLYIADGDNGRVLVYENNNNPLYCGQTNPFENCIINGSFEEQTITEHNGNWQLFSADTENLGWSVTSDKCTGKLEIQNRILGGASDGTQHAELDARCNTTISQDIATQNGTTYELTYDSKPRPAKSASADGMIVSVGNNVIDTVSYDWESHSKTFTADSDRTTVSFTATGKSDGYGIFLDNVVLKIIVVE